MQRLIIIYTLVLLNTHFVSAQKVVFDKNHFNIVNENGAVRSSAEQTHSNYLSTINNRLSDINLNISSVVLVQTMILNSLTQVDEALKSGIAVKQISRVSLQIIDESTKLLDIAKSDPVLLLFAEDVANQTKRKGLNLVSEVSEFILKEGNNALMDFEKREALLRKVFIELQIMRSLVFGMHRSIYYAKFNGVLKSVNPYKNFINKDMRMVDDILFEYSQIK